MYVYIISPEQTSIYVNAQNKFLMSNYHLRTKNGYVNWDGTYFFESDTPQSVSELPQGYNIKEYYWTTQKIVWTIILCISAVILISTMIYMGRIENTFSKVAHKIYAQKLLLQEAKCKGEDGLDIRKAIDELEDSINLSSESSNRICLLILDGFLILMGTGLGVMGS